MRYHRRRPARRRDVDGDQQGENGMTRPNGVHHLAICTAHMKEQIAFFTDVLGMELVALYWMHGVEGTWHGFLRLNLALTQQM